jgi:hypothetical protein
VAPQRLAFRTAFPAALWMAFVSILIGAALGVGGLLLRYGPDVNWPVVGVRFAWAVAFAFVLILVVVAVFRVFVGPVGLRGYTFWGNYRTLPWDEIDSVRPINLLGLRFLRVRGVGGGLPVWLPLFLADMPRFRTAVRDLAGDDHVLTRALA